MPMTLTPEFSPDADEDLPERVLAAIEEGLTPLEAVRVWKQHTVEHLSDLSGVSQATIHAVERGRELSPDAQIKLACALGVGADLILG
ncbi:helix-turn-helix domain-containing protein [Kaistia adipata]|uniref:helix-turn-helix domain-containing protein n=1 Tax=Kaistia adipata TaxID=166954 RepID=UPI000490E729|nr:helix-turn-helix transcriptional regulator [Kaistia adipata]